MSSQPFDPTDFEACLFHFLLSRADGAKESKSLKAWTARLNYCRKNREKGIETDLTEDQIKVLDHVNFSWAMNQDEKWKKRYRELVEFEAANGHCKVPRANGLGEWVSSQRKEKKKYDEGKKSSLTAERVEKLESIGFQWALANWNTMIGRLAHYRETNGHINVPLKDGPLGRWVSSQRKRYWAHKNGEKSTITDDEMKKLESIGFAWTVFEEEDGGDRETSTGTKSMKRRREGSTKDTPEMNQDEKWRWIEFD
ncbi:hypothetical protein ACHAWF_010453 [Thalassiosira exigua]